MLACFQESLEIVTFGRMVTSDMALELVSVCVPFVFAVMTGRFIADIFNSIAEPLPPASVRLTASRPSNLDQLSRGIGDMLSPFLGIQVLLSLDPDQRKGFAAFFAFPRVELHFTDAVVHIEAEVVGDTPKSVEHRMMSCFGLRGPFGC